MLEPRAIERRYALFYFCYFGGLGAFFPFVTLLFQARGLSPVQIGSVMLLIPIASLVVPPFWGVVADRLRQRVLLMRISIFGAGVTILGLIFAHGVLGIGAALAVFCFFRAPVVPLVDAASHATLGDDRSRFAAIRIWGSVGFAVFALVMGRLDASAHPVLLFAVPSVLCLLGALTTFFIPRSSSFEAPPSGRRREGMVRELFEFCVRAPIALLLLGNVIHHSGQASFDLYFALHAKGFGFDDGFIGLAWTVGVTAEILMMTVAPRLLRATSARTALVLCALAAALRWWLLARLDDRTGILIAQTLHALSFGFWYLSMVKYVQDRAPGHLRASVQSIGIATMGLGTIAGYTGGGYVFQTYGSAAVFRVVTITALVAAAAYAALGFRSGNAAPDRAASGRGTDVSNRSA